MNLLLDKIKYAMYRLIDAIGLRYDCQTDKALCEHYELASIVHKLVLQEINLLQKEIVDLVDQLLDVTPHGFFDHILHSHRIYWAEESFGYEFELKISRTRRDCQGFFCLKRMFDNMPYIKWSKGFDCFYIDEMAIRRNMRYTETVFNR